MTQESVFTADDILRLVRQRPFAPFRIHMSDGAAYYVDHPELVWVFPRRVTIGVPSRKEGLMQDYHNCALMHITRLEELGQTG